MWSFDRTSKFKKQFKHLDHLLQKKVEKTVNEFVLSNDPTKLGIYKKTMNVYAYELDKSNRLIYDVDFLNNVIYLIRVGDHKSSYGSD